MSDAYSPRAPTAAALYLGFVQFLFVTCWTVYVIFLPGPRSRSATARCR